LTGEKFKSVVAKGQRFFCSKNGQGCYIVLYRGPPVGSGTVQRILSNGHFRWQVLQCRQFDGLAGFGWL
jgi:hypothetical protein